MKTSVALHLKHSLKVNVPSNTTSFDPNGLQNAMVARMKKSGGLNYSGACSLYNLLNLPLSKK